MDLSPELIRETVVRLIILILSVAVHEFGHAFVADWLGDRLPRSQGRVTLNPAAHVDPIGTLALPAMGMLLGGGLGFGWGKPVMVNPVAFSRRFRMRTGHMLVALAGPAMNLVFAIVISFVTLILVKTSVVNPFTETGFGIWQKLLYAIQLNFVLMFFNLIPAAPLDGGTVLAGVLPDRLQPAYKEYSKYGIFVLIAIIAVPQLSRVFTWPAMKLFTLWVQSVLGGLRP